MKFIADFHIHSHYSVATSSALVPEHLEYWARLKGINVVGTGDCVHPGWLEELKEKLEPAENGLFRLKERFRLDESRSLPSVNKPAEVYFMLTGEISNIYKKNGKVRKVHNLCVFPDVASVENVQGRLDRMGNIRSDGRPILGLDSKILLEMVLESSGQSFLIPCHIWTPWFSVLGSKSGFDTIEECYDDLTRHIFAVETGLSSDPPMNRACGFLDSFRLVSNSDAHSPEKLGREANIFDTELSYGAIHRALKDDEGFLGTIEFFPQEGKYHYDGHRKCGVRWDPLETMRHRGLCPECGKPVTRGVLYRVAELADRKGPEGAPRSDFHSITQLPDLLAELMGQKSGKSGRVMKEFHRLVSGTGSEFYILLDASHDELIETGGERFAEAVRRLRAHEVVIEEGYDGEFGRIRVFDPGEARSFDGAGLFGPGPAASSPAAVHSSIRFDIEEFKLLLEAEGAPRDAVNIPAGADPKAAVRGMTAEQRAGIEHGEGPCLVIAGPGTGKTAILTRRIIHLVKNRGVPPAGILAVTFSNRAAGEMRERVEAAMPGGELTISTFHAFGLGILKKHYDAIARKEDFVIVDDEDRSAIMAAIARDEKKAKGMLAGIEKAKQGAPADAEIKKAMARYDEELRKANAVDLADLIILPLRIFRERPGVLEEYRNRYRWILVDEFQDINAAQYDFIRVLAGENNPNLFMIGDPDQAIYGFRGSDPRFMTRIEQDYPGTRLVRLDRSFRCPDPVMRAAAQILGRENAVSGRDVEMKVHIQETASDLSEADWIAATIEKKMGGLRSFSMDSGIADGDADDEGASFSDFAVLCRASFLFEPIIDAFRNHAIPCHVVGSDPLLFQEPYRGAVRSLKKLFYSGSDPSLSLAVASDIWGMIKKGDRIADVLKFLMVIIDAPEDAMRRIGAFAEQYGNSYHDFFRAVSLRQGADDRDDRAEAVSLMTIHASKGLQFKTVFIPACENGIIPFELFGVKEGDDGDEEERLFYVGVTRTLDNLYLSHAKRRAVKGRVLMQERSRFIGRLEEGLLLKGKRGRGKKPPSGDIQLDMFK
ncbi:MAG: UvrD-helicase domain-containing protein [Spirochaetes bacterium]|nr:UvrD-helicase domain-containing protein [Spirochaetota bacterium]